MIIEICANSFESATVAQKSGANRIELCENLSVGGLTPNRELIERVVNELDIPTHVLIRPRSGNFVYTFEEIQKMLDNIAFCKTMGCLGIVSGVLTSNGDIDYVATQQLMDASRGMEFTFHRAFDVCRSPFESLEVLKKLKVTRLLSSGQKSTAFEGLDLLKELKNRSEGKIQIMPGSGINKENAISFKKENFEAIHFSAIKKPKTPQSTSFFETGVEGTSSLILIKEIIESLA
jgi:copper homeostasis protein